MAVPRLVIGNKNYSSWSMRPWLIMKAAVVAFDEVLIPLNQPDTKARIAEYTPAGRVPVLIDGDIHVWETLAIIETVAEQHPGADIWPQDRAARAHARAIANEMHAGFAPMRNHLPMNLRRPERPHPKGMPADVQADVDRICEIVRDARARFGASGDFLFGAFSAADAMYAPVVTRFRTYALELGPVESAYVDALFAHPAFVEWRDAGLAETWTIAADEVD